MSADEYQVLIAGGGLVGLSTAMFLAQHGISSLAIERLRGGSPVPRAAFFHMRTIELFRNAGIEDEVANSRTRSSVVGQFDCGGGVCRCAARGMSVEGPIPLRSVVVRGRVGSFASTSGLAVQMREGHARDI